MTEHRLDAEPVATIRWVGDVDIATVTPLLAEIDAVLRRPGLGRLDFDLAELGFCDSIGLGTLVYAHNAAQERGVRVSVRNVTRTTRMLLEVAGLDHVLNVDPA